MDIYLYKNIYCRWSYLALVLVLATSASKADVIDTINPALLEKQLDAAEVIPQSESLSVKTIIPNKGISVQSAEIKLCLKKIIFLNGNVYPDYKLQKLASKYTEREITLGHLDQLANEVTNLYKNDGYILSRAVIPPQTLEKDGIAKIQIIEGFVDKVVYQGELAQISAHVKSFATKITKSRPLNTRDLERYLLLIRDLPGLQVKTILKPSAVQVNAADLVIITKREKISGMLNVNNGGSKYIGPYIVNMTATLNSLLDTEEQFIAHIVTTQKPQQLQHLHIVYNKFVGMDGIKLISSGSWTKTRPGNSLKVLKIIGDSKSFSVGIQNPLIRSRFKSLYSGLHFTLRNTNSSLLNNVKISTDKLRTISADLTLDVADRFRGVNLVQFTASQGVNIFSSTKNSSPNKSRAMGNPDFTKLNLEITRIQGLIGNFSLHGVIESQYALNSLLSSERFTYGDSPLFRSYTNAPISGDSGIKEKIILRYGKPIAKTFIKAYQIYGFYGYGTAWNRWVAGDEVKRTSASELGFGVNLSLLEDIRFNMEYSYPLRKKIGINKNRPVLFFYVIKKIAQRETK